MSNNNSENNNSNEAYQAQPSKPKKGFKNWSKKKKIFFFVIIAIVAVGVIGAIAGGGGGEENLPTYYYKTNEACKITLRNGEAKEYQKDGSYLRGEYTLEDDILTINYDYFVSSTDDDTSGDFNVTQKYVVKDRYIYRTDKIYGNASISGGESFSTPTNFTMYHEIMETTINFFDDSTYYYNLSGYRYEGNYTIKNGILCLQNGANGLFFYIDENGDTYKVCVENLSDYS